MLSTNLNDEQDFILLIEQHKKLVYFVAKRFIKRASVLKIEFDDLVSEGTIGLIKAIKKFDSSYGVKFSTYAVPMIQGEIQRAIRDTNPGLKFSRGAKEIAMKIEGTESVEEVMEKFQVKRKYAEAALAYKNNSGFTVSLEKNINSEEDKELTIADRIGDEDDYSYLEVEDFLKSLPSKLRTVVEMNMNKKPQSEIGKAIGVSQVQVSRIMKRIRKLYQSYLIGGEKEMEKLTAEEYKSYKKDGLTDSQIAAKKGISQGYVSQLKRAWFKNDSKPVIDTEVTSMTHNIKEDKTSEYKQLIKDLQTKLDISNSDCEEKAKMILGLEGIIQKYKGVGAEYEDKITALSTENHALKERVIELENIQAQKQLDDDRISFQKGQLNKLKNQLLEIQEENKYLKYFTIRYLINEEIQLVI